MRAIVCPLPVLLLLRFLVHGLSPPSQSRSIARCRTGRGRRNMPATARFFDPRAGGQPRTTSRLCAGEGGGESSWSLMVGEGENWSGPPKVSSEEVRSRLILELENLRQKDRQSRPLLPEDLRVLFEDDHIVLVDKPPGILTVPSEEGVPSLAQTVFDRFEQSKRRKPGHNIGDRAESDPAAEIVSKMDQMVVHRLGMETSGLILFAKTMDALRGMNSLFRSRRITRQYEVLVCGHVRRDQGLINLPLMRDFQFPPYMRVSTDELQRSLASFDPTVVGNKLLEAPKASLTHYQVKSREFLNQDRSLPVSRLTLTSITGRTHQLNVHMAAFGHAIVRDAVYGHNGRAAPYGGLNPARLSANVDLERAINEAGKALNMCVHASCIKFTHPVTNEFLSFTADAPF